MGHRKPNYGTVFDVAPAKEERFYAGRERTTVMTSPMYAQNKKSIIFKPSIKIKFGLHHFISYDKNSKIRPQLPMFAKYF